MNVIEKIIWSLPASGPGAVVGKMIELAVENWVTMGIGLAGGIIFTIGGLTGRLLGGILVAVVALPEIGAARGWGEEIGIYNKDEAGTFLIIGLMAIAANVILGLMASRLIAGTWSLGKGTKRGVIGMLVFFSWLPLVQPTLIQSPIDNLAVRIVYMAIACLIGFLGEFKLQMHR